MIFRACRDVMVGGGFGGRTQEQGFILLAEFPHSGDLHYLKTPQRVLSASATGQRTKSEIREINCNASVSSGNYLCSNYC